MPRLLDLWWSYRLRWKRREYLWRAIRARHDLTALQDNTAAIRPGEILCFSTMRNEAQRLPGFLQHYRKLGVDRFLIVVHDSTDETVALLRDQPDVSVWISTASYRDSRFGMDWLGWLLSRHGHGHWCLTVDADEMLIYPNWPDHDLHALGARLDAQDQPAMGALMLDLYPKGPLDQHPADPTPPTMGLDWFDPGPYRAQVQYPKWNRWVQGGTRERAFFSATPRKAPTLNKLPLVKWNRRYAYIVSTHSMLPRALNRAYDGPGDPRLSGVLLHTKFMPGIAHRSAEEKRRREHFTHAGEFDDYYDALTRAPDLWYDGAVRLTGWQQLVDLGLMSAGGWTPEAETR